MAVSKGILQEHSPRPFPKEFYNSLSKVILHKAFSNGAKSILQEHSASAFSTRALRGNAPTNFLIGILQVRSIKAFAKSIPKGILQGHSPEAYTKSIHQGNSPSVFCKDICQGNSQRAFSKSIHRGDS